MAKKYRFSFGPWNIHEGADPFGPPVRDSFSWDQKLAVYTQLGFEGVQFHDDDVVPDIGRFTHAQVLEKTREMRKRLEDLELVPEFVAPRLWEDPRTIDGGLTSNNAEERQWAVDRCVRAVEIAKELGSNLIVMWLAREGTYIRESKDPIRAVDRLVEGLNRMLAADKAIRIAIEPKPNEPMDQAYLPTIGHAIATAYLTDDPTRVGALLESAHAILAGLDPADEMAYALAHGKLWSVHLNDQNGLKYDQDKAFGAVDLRRAFQQVRILELSTFGRAGEMVGLDVKVQRTQKRDSSFSHLANSKATFERLLEKVRSLDEKQVEQYRSVRDYEGLDAYVIRHLLGSG
jgi:xylose isomerase